MDLLCASLTPDASGDEFRRLLASAHAHRASWLLCDWPRGASVPFELLQVAPQCMAHWEFSTAWYGDRTARYRLALLVSLQGAEVDGGTLRSVLQGGEVSTCETLLRVVLPPDALGPELWEGAPQADLLADDIQPGTAFDPRYAGWAKQEGERYPILSLRGPMPTHRGPRGQGAASPLRSTPTPGRGSSACVGWRKRKSGRRTGIPLRRGETCAPVGTTRRHSWACAQALPARSAQVLAAAVSAQTRAPRAGVGPDRDEEESATLLRAWLGAWRRVPQAPGAL